NTPSTHPCKRTLFLNSYFLSLLAETSTTHNLLSSNCIVAVDLGKMLQELDELVF
ncbi:hypothetical protein LINPERPRIM_LOCUS37983, partial [Linum perenne]